MAEPVLEKQWWGSIDGTLHLFNGLGGKGIAPIRVEHGAVCGFKAPGGLMEKPEDPPAYRKCIVCRGGER